MLILTIVTSLLAAAPASANFMLWQGNGNHYNFIPSNLTWHQAKTAAESMTFMGVSGHLATITSADENNFISTNFNTGLASNFAWIGGIEPNDNGIWRWAVGPETGLQFSMFGLPTAPFNYANWGGIEPNDFNPNEDFTMFNIGLTFGPIGQGQWADATPIPTPEDPVIGYVVEFETSSIMATPAPPAIMLMLLGVGTTGLVGCVRRRQA
jgi:hypothetical protein